MPRIDATGQTGVTEQTCCRPKKKYGGTGTGQLGELKRLGKEHERLRRACIGLVRSPMLSRLSRAHKENRLLRTTYVMETLRVQHTVFVCHLGKTGHAAGRELHPCPDQRDPEPSPPLHNRFLDPPARPKRSAGPDDKPKGLRELVSRQSPTQSTEQKHS
jgi:hypothetical protein